MKKRLEVGYLPDAVDFINSLDKKHQDKLYELIEFVSHSQQNDPSKFKKLEGSSIWKFRTRFGRQRIRLFAFWDKEGETLVIATHGIIKKRHQRKLIEQSH